MRSVIERQWTAHGLDCAVLLLSRDYVGDYRCGYVGVPPSHPWHGLDYDDEVPNPQPIPENAGVDDYGLVGMVALLAGQVPEHVCRLDMQVRVHGGVTYAGAAPGDLPSGWWFGFDCAHAYDTPDEWTEEAVAVEVERMAEQIASFTGVAA